VAESGCYDARTFRATPRYGGDRHRCRTLPTRLLEPTTPGVKSVLICGGGEAPMCGSCSDLVVEDMAAVTEARQTESNEFYLFERAAGDLLKPLRGLR
jgi:hypothetical protein